METRIRVGIVAVIVATLALGSCRRAASTASAVLSEAAMEAALEQSINTYKSASGSVTTGRGTASFKCERSGTGTYSKTESGGKVCWKSNMQACEFNGYHGGQLHLTGDTTLCYSSSATLTATGIEGLAQAGTIDFTGSLTAGGTSATGYTFTDRTCTYSFTSAVTASKEGSLSCADVNLVGSINCGAGTKDASETRGGQVHLCVSSAIVVQ